MYRQVGKKNPPSKGIEDGHRKKWCGGNPGTASLYKYLSAAKGGNNLR
jgi:hypothetical protein